MSWASAGPLAGVLDRRSLPTVQTQMAGRLGSCSRGQLPGQCYRVWIASGADSDEARSLGSVTRIVTRAGARVRSVRVRPLQRPAARHARPSVGRTLRRPASRLGPGKPSQGRAVSSWTGRRACRRSAGTAPGRPLRPGRCPPLTNGLPRLLPRPAGPCGPRIASASLGRRAVRRRLSCLGHRLGRLLVCWSIGFY